MGLCMGRPNKMNNINKQTNKQTKIIIIYHCLNLLVVTRVSSVMLCIVCGVRPSVTRQYWVQKAEPEMMDSLKGSQRLTSLISDEKILQQFEVIHSPTVTQWHSFCHWNTCTLAAVDETVIRMTSSRTVAYQYTHSATVKREFPDNGMSSAFSQSIDWSIDQYN